MVHYRQGGFSLIELVIVIAALGIVVAAGSGIVGDSLKVVRSLNATSGSSSDTRTAMDRVTRELRAVTLKRADDTDLVNEPTGYLFRHAEASSVKFAKFGREIEISLSNSNLTLTVDNNNPEVLLTGVGSLQLRYWKSLDEPSLPVCAHTNAVPVDCDALRTNVRLVEISLSNVDRGSGAPVSLRTFAALRSR